MNRRVFTLAALALAGCAGTPPPIVTPGQTLEELEPLYNADAGREALTISVASNGCTAKADFAVHVETKGQATTVAFARKRLDTCKSFAMGKTNISFTWAELGVAPRTPVFLLNPLIAWTGPGR